MEPSRRASMLVILCMIILGSLSVPVWALPSAQDSITLGIDPMTQAVSIDSEFLVTVYVDSGQEPIDGVQVTLAFDPAHLSVVELVPGSALPDVFPAPTALPDGYSNPEGRISFAAGKLGADLPKGKFGVLTIRFHAEALTTGTLVEFTDDPNLHISKVTHGGVNLGINLIPSVIAIVSSGEPTSTQEPAATASPTTTSTETPMPTDTPEAPEPTSTSGPYPWQEGTATPTPTPVFTNTPVGTPTSTPTPTPTLFPTPPPTGAAPATETLPSRRDDTPTLVPSVNPTTPPPAIPEAPAPTATAAPQQTAPPPSSTPEPTATPEPQATSTPPPPTVAGKTVAPPPSATARLEDIENTIAAPKPTASLWTSLLTEHIWSTLGIVAIALFSLGFAILRRQLVALDEDGGIDEGEE